MRRSVGSLYIDDNDDGKDDDDCEMKHHGLSPVLMLKQPFTNND